MRRPRVTILAPAFNEADVIEAFVAATLEEMSPDWELLIVDDGSTDETPAILERLGNLDGRLRVITHKVNKGLGQALRTGFTGAAGDVIVTMDADQSHPFELVPRLVEACADADAAFGSRFVEGGGMVGIPKKRSAISVVGNRVFRLLFVTEVKDLTTGLRAYRAEVVRDLDLRAKGFGIQLEISTNLIANHRKIAELPLVLKNRSAGESKMRYLPLLPTYVLTLFSMIWLRWVGRRPSRVVGSQGPDAAPVASLPAEPESSLISSNDSTRSAPVRSGQDASQ